jgi:hypothetical protein
MYPPIPSLPPSADDAFAGLPSDDSIDPDLLSQIARAVEGTDSVQPLFNPALAATGFDGGNEASAPYASQAEDSFVDAYPASHDETQGFAEEDGGYAGQEGEGVYERYDEGDEMYDEHEEGA